MSVVGDAAATGTHRPARSPSLKTPCERAADEFGIVVADDHLSYVEALAIALRLTRGDHVWGAETLDELLETVDQAKVVVLDWQFGDTDGIRVAEILRSRPRPPHVVMVTGHHSPAFERLARGAGVCATFPKSASIEEIGHALDRCRDEPEHERTTTTTPLPPDVLSRRQIEVLWLLSLGHDTSDVATRLYLSVATVRTYIRDACRRLGAHSQLEAVAKARRAGLIPSESTPPPMSPA